jgi:hypothetical protein
MKELHRRLQRLARDLDEPTLSWGEVDALLATVVNVVRRHVTNRETLSAIAEDLRRSSVSPAASKPP